jgi:hypothetical protein
MTTCPICRDTDEMCSHTAPAVTADGRGYTIATGDEPPTWAALAHPSSSYLLGLITAALDTLARHEATIAAQGERLARLEAEAERSETP